MSFYAQYPFEGGGSGSGVSSLNSLTGALTLVAGTGISITPSGSNITITNTGSGTGNITQGGNAFGTNMILGETDAFGLELITNNTQRILIDQSGYIGIVANPQNSGNAANQVNLVTSSIGSGVQQNFNGLLVEVDLNNTSDGSGFQQAIQGVIHCQANTGTYALLRNYFMAESVGNCTITETYGARALTRIYDENYPTLTTTGTITNGYGLEAYAHSTSTTGTMQNATGIVISHAVASGPNGGVAFNARGLWIQNDISATGGSTNTAWAIDSESTANTKLSGNLQMYNAAPVQFFNAANSHYVALQPGTLSGNTTWTLPTADGSNLQVLQTNGSGVLGWATLPASGGNVNYGGDSFSGAQVIGSTNSHEFSLITNGTARLNIEAGGTVLVGGDTGNFSPVPTTFGVFGYNTTDGTTPSEAFLNYFNYTGNSSNSRDGSQFSFSLTPGGGNSYTGQYNSLSAYNYTNAGTVSTATGLSATVNTLNSSSLLGIGIGGQFLVAPVSGEIKNAAGIQISNVQATGTGSGSAHSAIGVDIAPSGTSIVASGGATGFNSAIGLRIGATITGDAGQTFAIQSSSTSPSTFAGTLSATGLTLTTTPLGVASGGTGDASFTAYSVVCAGTTSTGTFQNVSGLGSSGQVLTSNGAGALPTWQAAGGSGSGFNYLSSSTSVYGGTNSTLSFTGADNTVIGVSAGSGLTSGAYNTFIGYQAGDNIVAAFENVAIGSGAGPTADNQSTTCIGYGANATGNNSTVIGQGSQASGAKNVAVGSGAHAGSGQQCVAIGYTAMANASTGVIAIGYQANATGAYSTILGTNATDSGAGGTVAIGQSTPTSNSHTGCFLVGTTTNGFQSSNTTAAGQICFGTTGTGSMTLGQMFLGRGAVGDATAPSCSIQPSPVVGSNIAGGSLTIAGGNGTGTGGSGAIIFQTAPVAGSSSTANTLATVMNIANTGAITFGATSTTPQHILNTQTATGSGTSTLGTTNSPGGSTPAGWIQITINGTTRYMPFF